MQLKSEIISKIVKEALDEDLGTGDITTDAIVSDEMMGEAEILFKEPGVIAGLPVFKAVFQQLTQQVEFEEYIKEGQRVESQQLALRLKAKMSILLKGERTALNFLQRLSGIATLTSKYVQAVEGTTTQILDTRKTTPTLRELEKYAVRIGGATNYRSGLFDAVMIKDNHIKAAGSIVRAVKSVINQYQARYTIIVEASDLDQVKKAAKLSINRIMLDNMDIEMTKEAIDIIQGRVEVEASGGMTPEKAKQVAPLGVNYISVGAITNRAVALDISMNIK